MTYAQRRSLVRVVHHQGWDKIEKIYDCGEYLGVMTSCGMFIGIERDGYAHT